MQICLWAQERREDLFSGSPLRVSPVSPGLPVSPELMVALASPGLSESPVSSGSCHNIAPYAAIVLRGNIMALRPAMGAKDSSGDPSERITSTPVGESYSRSSSFFLFVSFPIS